MQLTPTELSQFHTDGFIILENFLDEKSCDDILEVASRHLGDKVEPIETEIGYREGSKEQRTNEIDYRSNAHKEKMIVRRLRQVYSRDILFKEWMENEEIRPVLQEILGEQAVLLTAHHNSIMTKLPHVSTETAWHQDRRYWRYSNDNLVSVWLALDDEDSMNGVLEFIPGSHNQHFGSEHFDEKEYFSKEYEINQPYIQKKVSLSLKKGDVVLFHSLLLHRANQNFTDKVKISFVYTVKGKHTKAKAGSRSSGFPEITLEKI